MLQNLYMNSVTKVGLRITSLMNDQLSICKTHDHNYYCVLFKTNLDKERMFIPLKKGIYNAFVGVAFFFFKR